MIHLPGYSYDRTQISEFFSITLRIRIFPNKISIVEIINIKYFCLISVQCIGRSKIETKDCCTIENPCKIDQGDCDHDAECEDDLVCGNNNCGDEFSWNSADCCEKNCTYFLKE